MKACSQIFFVLFWHKQDFAKKPFNISYKIKKKVEPTLMMEKGLFVLYR